jgi:hypothetical protein
MVLHDESSKCGASASRGTSVGCPYRITDHSPFSDLNHGFFSRSTRGLRIGRRL